MVKCSFSGETIKKGTGIMYVTKTGKIHYFKNRKCEKNMMQLKRKAVKYKWTRVSQKKRAQIKPQVKETKEKATKQSAPAKKVAEKKAQPKKEKK